MQLVILLFGVVWTYPVALYALDCEASGYCSLGISKAWTGSITQGAALRAMLEAVSYKKELIFTSLSHESIEDWGGMALQLHNEVTQLGFGHFFVLVLQQEDCNTLHAIVGNTTLSCVWDSSLDGSNYIPGAARAWLARWRFMARATRLGYNVMTVDVDFMFLRDPYLHLKKPPLQEHKMLCLRESGGPLHCNGGFMYVQNALPNGPITWILKNAVENNAWIQDHDWQYFNDTGGLRYCYTDDQDMLMDAAASAAVGRPLAQRFLSSCKPTLKSRDAQGIEVTYASASAAIQYILNENKRFSFDQARPDAASVHDYHVLQTEILLTNLTVPNLNYGYPEELGGAFGPSTGGRDHRAAWKATLQSDCPACPWWSELRPIKGGRDPLREVLPANLKEGVRPVAGDAWRADLFWDEGLPTEQLVMAPMWLISSMKHARQGTILGYNATFAQPSPVMVHMHVWHGLTQSISKMHIRQILGRYHWGLGQRVLAHFNRPGPYTPPQPVTRLLALHPDIDLSRTRNIKEYHTIVTGLLQVALLSNRTLILPDLPCNTSWAHWAPSSGSGPTPWAWATLPDHLKGFPSKQNPSGCLNHFTQPPLFSDRFNMDAVPLAIPYPTDDKGRLLGGWLWGLEQPSQQPSQQPNRQLAAAVGMAGGALSGGGVREEAWWRDFRYRMTLPHMWDSACTKALPIITPAEAAHWLATHPLPPGPKQTNLTSATVLGRLPGHLDLTHPQQQAEMMNWTASQEAQKQPGWSLADVQVTLPVGLVLSEVSKHSEVQLLYVGHPVAVVLGSKWLSARKLQRQAALAGEPLGRTQRQGKHLATVGEHGTREQRLETVGEEGLQQQAMQRGLLEAGIGQSLETVGDEELQRVAVGVGLKEAEGLRQAAVAGHGLMGAGRGLPAAAVQQRAATQPQAAVEGIPMDQSEPVAGMGTSGLIARRSVQQAALDSVLKPAKYVPNVQDVKETVWKDVRRIDGHDSDDVDDDVQASAGSGLALSDDDLSDMNGRIKSPSTALLERINQQIQSSQCKAAWAILDPPDLSKPTYVLKFADVQPGILQNGLLRQASRPQASAPGRGPRANGKNGPRQERVRKSRAERKQKTEDELDVEEEKEEDARQRLADRQGGFDPAQAVLGAERPQLTQQQPLAQGNTPKVAV